MSNGHLSDEAKERISKYLEDYEVRHFKKRTFFWLALVAANIGLLITISGFLFWKAPKTIASVYNMDTEVTNAHENLDKLRELSPLIMGEDGRRLLEQMRLLSQYSDDVDWAAEVGRLTIENSVLSSELARIRKQMTDGVFDTLRCNKLTVISANGDFNVAEIAKDQYGNGSIRLSSGKGQQHVQLYSTGLYGLMILTHDETPSVELGSGLWGGELTLHSESDEDTGAFLDTEKLWFRGPDLRVVKEF